MLVTEVVVRCEVEGGDASALRSEVVVLVVVAAVVSSGGRRYFVQ